MIIFFCTNTYESSGNGPSKFAKYVSSLNDRENVEVHMITEDLNFADKYHHKVKITKSFLSSIVGMLTRIDDYYRAVLELISKGIRPDVIVFNNAIIGIKTYKKTDIPCIGMINDYSSLKASITTYGISKEYIRYKTFQYFESLACKYAKKIIVNSQNLKELILSKYKHAECKTQILYKATEIKENKTSNSFLTYRPVKILFVKTDWYRGGLDVLIKSLNSLSIACELSVIGPEKSEFEKIKSFLKSQKIKLNLCGRKTQEEVFQELMDSDIFCTPSRQEALGVANIEALAHKIPVVYSNVGGIPEVMNYGENGFISEGGNVNSLAAAIQKCVNNSNERKEKIESGYNFVKEKFNKESMLESFIKIVRDVAFS